MKQQVKQDMVGAIADCLVADHVDLMREVETLRAQRDELAAALGQTWCSSTDDNHAIGDQSEAAKNCPVCADARAALAKVQS